MTRPTVDDMKAMLRGIADEVGLSVATICLKGQTTGAALHARRRFMKAARALGARPTVIVAALDGAVTPARGSQMLKIDIPDRSPEDRVRAMLAAVAAESGLPRAEICDGRCRGDHAIARRIVMQQAADIGARASVIARVLGVQYQSVCKMLARHAETRGAVLADPLSPFRSRRGWLPLLLSDYCHRAGVDEAVARAALDDLRVMRRVTVETFTAGGQVVRIYEVTPECRQDAAA